MSATESTDLPPLLFLRSILTVLAAVLFGPCIAVLLLFVVLHMALVLACLVGIAALVLLPMLMSLAVCASIVIVAVAVAAEEDAVEGSESFGM